MILKGSEADRFTNLGIKAGDKVLAGVHPTPREVAFIGTQKVILRTPEGGEYNSDPGCTYKKVEPWHDWPEDAKELLRLTIAERDYQSSSCLRRRSGDYSQCNKTTSDLYRFLDKISPRK